MNGNLITALRTEEELILVELRGSRAFHRLEQVRRLLDLYDARPPVGADLDAMLGDADLAASRRPAPAEPVILLHCETRTAEVA